MPRFSKTGSVTEGDKDFAHPWASTYQNNNSVQKGGHEENFYFFETSHLNIMYNNFIIN